MTDATPSPDSAVTSLTAKAGDKVDNYTIMEQIGAGGTAIVFRGHDHVINRDVAIKQIVMPQGDTGEDMRQQALTESAMHKKVAASDPKLLVQYIDTINDPRGLFLISEYIDGPSLEWMLQQETRPMDPRQALGIVAATAKALDALHQNGVVHRDLKPSNILMPREGGLKLGDFGLATLVAEQQTMDLGSVRYMAPEVLQGQPATPKSDLYSLGMVAYEMLAGRDNFNDAFRTILRDQRNQSMRWVKWHTNVRAKVAPLDQLVDEISPSLAQLVARMMEKDPARRVGSSAELLEAIRSHFAQSNQEQAAPGPHAAMAPPKIDDISQTAAIPQKSLLPLILTATFAVCLLAIGFVLWNVNHRDQQALEQQTATLIDAIEKADNLIAAQKYEEASTAFLQIPTDERFSGMFDPNNRRYRDDLVEAGAFKAGALRAAGNSDYITALEKAKGYRQRMSQWSTQPPSPQTELSRINADNMIDQYESRAAFQEQADEIQTLLDAGELDKAIQAVRQMRNIATDNTADADLRRLEDLQKQYDTLLADKGIRDLLEEAQKLANNDELDDAIELLEKHTEDADEANREPDVRVMALLESLNKRDLIDTIKGRVARAERSGDPKDLLDTLKELQAAQPTQALDVRIEELEITILLGRADLALKNDRPGQAQAILTEVKERDPGNAEAERMLSQIQNAELKLAAIQKADQHYANGEYADAIKQYKQALTYGPDSTGRLADRIKDAQGRIHFANSEKAMEKGDVGLAQSELDKAKAELGSTDAIDTLQDEIDDLRDYSTLVTEGDTLFASNRYGDAKAKYLAAKKIFNSDAINEKIRNCDFSSWLQTCDRAMLSRDWETAESALKRAEEIKINAQTEQRREKIESRVQ